MGSYTDLFTGSGNYLSQHLDWHGFLVFSFLFVAFFYAWADSSVYNSLYISTDAPHAIIMALQIVTTMFAAAALSSVTEEGWFFFALSFSANRALTALLYWRACNHDNNQNRLAYEMCRNLLVLAIVFGISAFLPRPHAYWLFGAGIIAIQLQYMLPRVGTLRFKRFVPRLGHIAERFGLIMLILLGEGFFKLVVTMSDKGIHNLEMGSYFNIAIGGLSLFILAWIYFDGVGNAKPKSRATATLVAYWFGHMILMWATVMIGVALAGQVYVGFLEPYPYKYGILGTMGLAIFLATVWLLQRLVEGRDNNRKFSHGGVRLFGIAVSMALLILLPYVPAIIGNALFAIALFSQIFWPMKIALMEIKEKG